MKHYQTKVEQYKGLISLWDKTHRIVGDLKHLDANINASFEALLELNKNTESKVLVDVGAGSGILGFPWLFICDRHRCVFVEPDKKKASFLSLAISELGLGNKALLAAQPIELVSRETFEKFIGSESPLFCSRAFSGAKDLESALKLCTYPIKEHHYFEILEKRPVLTKKHLK